ncbi:hypothetical protein [Swingsia samuiensis]|uniref:Flagellar protein FlgN n=1 Tax=Swingsia samuiensis TaxID=1293412 RepID=A0A4Y6UJV1_9PROT|nr:hypothetical protein [Swingsia samuiensis]QDH16647.1 hypothetical protein E3D00_02960 [Swingsia samuiensis]
MKSAIINLTDIIHHENAALINADFPTILRLIPEKQKTINTLEAILNNNESPYPTAKQDIQKLLEVAQRNKDLLQETITFQKNLISTVTQLPEQQNQQSYGEQGHYSPKAPEQTGFFIHTV